MVEGVKSRLARVGSLPRRASGRTVVIVPNWKIFDS